MKYNHEKSFGSVLVFEALGWDIVILKEAFYDKSIRHVGAIYKDKTVTPLTNESFLFLEAKSHWEGE